MSFAERIVQADRLDKARVWARMERVRRAVEIQAQCYRIRKIREDNA